MTDRNTMNLVVAGSRDLRGEHFDLVSGAIKSWIAIHGRDKRIRIVEGGANGADTLARVFAILEGLDRVTVEADWNTRGKAAGPMRNARMIEHADGLVVIRFPDSRGSADVLRRAKARGLPIVDVVLSRGGR